MLKNGLIYSAQVRKLHAYMMRYLRDIMNIKWYEKVTSEEIIRRANLPPMADILIERNLSWLGHVHRMEHDRLPPQLLYSPLYNGQRNHRRPGFKFKDEAKNIKLRKIGVKSKGRQLQTTELH